MTNCKDKACAVICALGFWMGAALAEPVCVRVRSADQQEPIYASVIVVPAGQTPKFSGVTDENTGELTMEKPAAETFILILPKLSALFLPAFVPSGQMNEVRLDRITTVSLRHLTSHLTYDWDEPSYAEALVSNELADREKRKPDGLAFEYYCSVLLSVLLQVKAPFHYEDYRHRLIVSDEFESALRTFQNRVGLRQNGRIDYATLYRGAKFDHSAESLGRENASN